MDFFIRDFKKSFLFKKVYKKYYKKQSYKKITDPRLLLLYLQSSTCTVVGLVASNWVEAMFILFMLGILVLHHSQPTLLPTSLLVLNILLALRELLQLRSEPTHPPLRSKGQSTGTRISLFVVRKTHNKSD